jgi:DNA invertase Pin-like site-specific DNA recombinase
VLERQLDGIRIAKAEGNNKGRKATALAKSEGVLRLLSEGSTKEATAERLGIGVASVYRIVKSVKSTKV